MTILARLAILSITSLQIFIVSTPSPFLARGMGWEREDKAISKILQKGGFVRLIWRGLDGKGVVNFGRGVQSF